MSDTASIVKSAWAERTVVPAFNIPYLPMMEPVVRALADTKAFGLIQVARLEWEKFEARSPEAIAEEYEKAKDERFMRLHLDHVPVIDEDGRAVDYLDIIRRALRVGYGSVMVDASRLDFAGNVAATRKVVEMAHEVGVPVEAELGAVLGHESGPLPPYEELFASGHGFTDPDEAGRFVEQTGVDWLSVSIGNIHGAISGAARKQKKVEARLALDHLSRIAEKANVPLVLHGGSGIKLDNVLEGVKRGIAKINIGTAIRAPFEANLERGLRTALDATYAATVQEIANLRIEDSAAKLLA
jgi:fructose-bisphosphate aldolase, class II